MSEPDVNPEPIHQEKFEKEPSRHQRRVAEEARKYLSRLTVSFLESIQRFGLTDGLVAKKMDDLDREWKKYCVKKRLTKESFKAFGTECELLVQKIEKADEIINTNEKGSVSEPQQG